MANLTALPDRFNAGETVKYSKNYADYPANAGWTAILYLAGASVLNVSGAANGAAFDFTLTAAQTGALLQGVYRWEERVTKAGETFIADEGTTIVDPNIANATAGSLQDYKEKLLGEVEAAISSMLAGKVAEFQILGHAARYLDFDDLVKLRGQLKREIAAGAFRGKFGPTIQTHFVRPS